MALHEYGSINRVILEGRNVFTDVKAIYGSWVKMDGVLIETTYGKMYEYTRRVTGHYQYVGMDKNTAEQCAEDMKEYYTFTKYYTFWNHEQGVFDKKEAGDMLMAQVKVCTEDGMLYNVDINLNECDIKESISNLDGTLFTHEEQRQHEI